MAYGLLLIGLLIGVLAGCETNEQPQIQMTDTLTSPNPEKRGHFGDPVTDVGDVTGDGTPDLLVGARKESPGGTEDAGRAYVFDGAGGELLHTLTSPNLEEHGFFGRSLAGVGDVTGDGTPDLLVGAQSEMTGLEQGAGRAYLFDGAGGELHRTLTAPNPEDGGHFGASLISVGDVTGDGTPDLLVGAHRESPGGKEDAGRVYLFDGAEGEVLRTLTSPNPEDSGWFGVSLGAVGDLSGDGTPDLLVGAFRESPGGTRTAGRAYLFGGAEGELLRTLTSPNPEEGGVFGGSLAAVGDLSGDGTPDLLIGADSESPGGKEEAGRAYLFDGAGEEVLRTLTSPNPQDEGHFGVSLAGVGDVTGDGTPDLLVGASGESRGGTQPTNNAGRAYVIDGAGGELLRTLTSPNQEHSVWFGSSIAAVGDVTGDGTQDLLFGARWESPGGTRGAGRVYRFDVHLP